MENDPKFLFVDFMRNLFTVLVVFVACGALVISCYAIYSNLQSSERAAIRAGATHDALCSLKLDIEGRHDRAVEFLKDNPEGIPGLSARLIQRGINAQAQTLNSLRNLECRSIEPPLPSL